MKKEGMVIISLDTELHYGVINTRSRYRQELLTKRTSLGEPISFLVDLFEQYEIPVTWAIVGLIFKEHPTIVSKIMSSKVVHEVASHSYSHIDYSCANEEEVDSDLYKCKQHASAWGIDLQSFIFPQDRIAYLEKVKLHGFKIYRGKNEGALSYKKGNPIARVKNRAIPKSVQIRRDQNGLICLPSSMKLTDFRFPYFLFSRARKGIDNVVNNGGILHLYFHPWNLVINPTFKEVLNELGPYLYNKMDSGQVTIKKMADFLQE